MGGVKVMNIDGCPFKPFKFLDSITIYERVLTLISEAYEALMSRLSFIAGGFGVGFL